MASKSPSALFVTRIEVEQLFGHYSYDLRPEADPAELSRILIVYGENGTGKTTLLWLILHLLSRERGKGHRTYLAQSRFRRLAVHFNDDSEIVAKRTGESLSGSFEMVYTSVSGRHSFAYNTDDKGTIPALDDKLHDRFTAVLPDLNIKFLADDRKISTDLDLEEQAERAVAVYWDREISMLRGPNVIRPLSGRGAPSSVPRWETAIDRAVQWVREQALRASNQGQHDFNAIYEDIVRRVGRPSSQKTAKLNPEDLIRMLENQAERTQSYAKFGLTSELRVVNLIQSIQKVETRRLGIIAQILRPYIEGNEARLRALGSLQRSIQTFVDSINRFFINKEITFDLREGLKIVTGSGEPLHPARLSSGEKQLLILFCNIISSTDQSTIFIIDEPELSLNVTWQRQLIDAMTNCVGQNQVQFLFATHSLELLSRHSSKVAKLINILPPDRVTPTPVHEIAPAEAEG